MPHRLHRGRVVLIGAALWLAVPSVALADGGPAFTVGPVKVKHGYTATADGFSCGTKFAGGAVSFTKMGKGWTETHSFGGANNATCQIAGNLASGTLKYKFNGVTVSVKFRKKGQAQTGTVPAGCSGPKPKTQPGIATGTVKISISKSFFGSVRVSRVKASVTKVAYTCSGEPNSLKKTAFLNAFEGSESNATILSASQPPTGVRTVSIIKSVSGANMSSSHILTLTGGSSLFSVKSDLSSAKVNGTGKLGGHLTFNATPSCKGTNRTGTLSGSLTAKLDLIGRLTIKENKQQPPTLSRNATGGPCS
ncbi:MAG TPA: hypothetical protein VGF70_09940 [Solirubrobacteraceae bacterium]